jgi:hypothetical protein
VKQTRIWARGSRLSALVVLIALFCGSGPNSALLRLSLRPLAATVRGRQNSAPKVKPGWVQPLAAATFPICIGLISAITASM